LFFSRDPIFGKYGLELWKSDGTTSGTVLVKSIRPSANNGLKGLTNVDGTLFFRAYDGGTYGTELWKSDGTASGTVLVKDISPGSGSSCPDGLTNVSGTLFFGANDGVGLGLWKSDGTEAGTVLVKDIDIWPKPCGTISSSLTNVDGTLYFSVSEGKSLWAAIIVPSSPVVTGTTPNHSTTPTWTWTSGGGGNGTFRYKLNDESLETGATVTTSTSFTPSSSPLSYGDHTLYVQEQNDQGYWSDSGSFTITIEVNDPPVAQDGSSVTDCDLAVSIPLSGTDPEGGPLSFLLVEGPTNGTIIINGSSATYYPDVDFIGTDLFTFKANDGELDGNVASISITVDPVGQLSAAVNLSLEKHILFFPRRIEAEAFSLSGQSTTSSVEFSQGIGVELTNGGFIEYTVPFSSAPHILRTRYKTTANTGSSELVIYVNGQEKDRIALAGDPNTLYLKKTAALSLATNDTVMLQLSGSSGNTVHLDFVEFFPTQSDAPALTVVQDAGQTLKAGDQIAILIPAGIFSQWDDSVTQVTLSGNASAKVDPNVSYTLHNKACIFTVTQDFAAGDEIRISGLKFISQDIPSGPGRLKLALNGDWQHVASSKGIVCTPIAAVKMGVRSLAAGQSEEVGPITIIDMIPAQIQKEKGLKLVIPDDVPVTWDNSITTVTLSGTAKDRVSPEVSYSDNNKEMLLQLREDFFFADCLQVSGLKAKAGQDCLFKAIQVKDTVGYIIAEQN